MPDEKNLEKMLFRADTIRERLGKTFFMPAIKDSVQRDEYYQLAKYNMKKSGFAVFDNRIYRIKFNHKGVEFEDKVGVESESNNEVVIAIFESADGLCLTCTNSSGFMGGEPLLSNPHYRRLLRKEIKRICGEYNTYGKVSKIATPEDFRVGNRFVDAIFRVCSTAAFLISVALLTCYMILSA